ncbi:hypothetical protein ACLOJK_012243 [Asimina triloba]
MGKRKQSRPTKSGGILSDFNATDSTEQNLENAEHLGPTDSTERGSIVDPSKHFYVEVDRSCWQLAEHFDIAEVVLLDIKFADGFSDYKLAEDCQQESNLSLRFRVCTSEDHSFRLGHWPIISAGNITLELVQENYQADEKKTLDVIFFGSFDGPDEGVSGLVYLASQKFLTLRPILKARYLENGLSYRMRVEILKSAFDACGSLLENTRQPWRKSMMNVISWLRPEVTAQEAKYGTSKMRTEVHEDYVEMTANCVSRNRARFDAAGFYEAIRPSKGEQMLEHELPDLCPQLRPYQRRASFWMVQREIGTAAALSDNNQDRLFDEMGLGKTVELLACIFAHRKLSSECGILFDEEIRNDGSHKSNMRRLKIERIECICGAVNESPKYKGLWVQCDVCDAWQHADCVGYSPRSETSESCRVSVGKHKKNQSMKSKSHSGKKDDTNIVLMDGNYICSLCSELIEATGSTITSGATLIVCPGPILQQWHSEITRSIAQESEEVDKDIASTIQAGRKQ